MKKRIYLSIIYFITLICIIIGVLGNVFNISPFTRMTMASSGKYIENSSIYDNVSDISVDMNLGSVEIKKGSKLEVIYTGAEKFKPAVSVSGTSLNIEQHVKVHLMTNIKNSDCTLTITIPDNVSLNSIQADLNMGDMDVNNIHASSGDFSIDKPITNCTCLTAIDKEAFACMRVLLYFNALYTLLRLELINSHSL